MSLFSSFPVEVVDNITAYTTKGTCYSLLLTCSRLCPIAERTLYRKVVLRDTIILSFVRALHNASPEDRRIKCNMIKRLVIISTSTIVMSHANPWLPALMRLMHNVQTLELASDGEPANIFYMFLCRAGLVKRATMPDISTLAPINDDCEDTHLSLHRLQHLTVSGNPLFLKLAEGRTLKSITVTSLTDMIHSVSSAPQPLEIIGGDTKSYSCLRSISLAMFLGSKKDLVDVMKRLNDLLPQLEELDLRVFSVMRNSDNSDLDWLQGIPPMHIRTLSMRGSLRAVLPFEVDANDIFVAVSEHVGSRFADRLPKLQLLEINQSRWELMPNGWAFVILPHINYKWQYHLWSCFLPSTLDENDISRHGLRRLKSQWKSVENRWETCTGMGKYRNTQFIIDAPAGL